MARIPVIIDTDPGIDDFFAIMLANSSDKLDIKAITTVAGNQEPEIVTKNALDITDYFNIDIEVAKGAEEPLNIPLSTAGHIHGKNGLGNLQLPTGNKQISGKYAWDVIYEKAVEENGKLEIIAIGPLTNIAIAILKYPDLVKLISRIVLMGGSSDIGNSSPYGEFNAVTDPLATKIVFGAKIPLVMVGWNVAIKTALTVEEVEKLTAIKTPYTDACTTLIEFLQQAYEIFGKKDIVLSDALAVAYAIDANVMECKDYFVTVETKSSLNMGRTVVDFDSVCKGERLNCSVGVDVNKDIYLELLVKMMHHYKNK